MLFINYELIDYKTGVPLKKDEIFGRNNNYNILQTEKICYINDNKFEDKVDKISDIIFNNISGCLEKVANNKYHIDSFSFVHNLFVVTDKLKNRCIRGK